MGLSGDFGELDRLIDRLEDIRAKRLQGQLSRALAEEAIELVHQGFEDEADPFGKEWAQLTSRDGRALQKDGHLLSSFHVVRSNPEGFAIGSNERYVHVHQYGATIVPKAKKWLRFIVGGEVVFSKKVVIPARPMLPGANELPPAWDEAFRETADELLKAHMGTK